MYIDDGFLARKSVTECTAAVQCILETIVCLGFLPHLKKCMLVPSQQVHILGFIINSVTMTISEEKQVEIQNMCVTAMADPTMSIRQLSQLIRKMISVVLALPLGQAHFCRLEKVKTTALVRSNGNFDVPCTLPSWVFADLMWWTKHIFSASAPLCQDPPQISLFSDASSYGWGSIVLGAKAQGRFLPAEQQFSINTKECLAIYYGVRSFVNILHNKHVRIRTDNTTAVSAVLKMGSSSSTV